MIVGFNFTRISAEKMEGYKGKIDINNNVAIKDVLQEDISLGKEKQNIIKFKFEFTSKYEPSLGMILFEGNVLYLDEPKKVREIVASWKKDKKIPKELMALLLNQIMTKCNIHAIVLSQDINLPPPIPLPKVQMPAEKN